jgi:hypothetical protein
MTLGELWNGFRILLGLGLIGLALVLGYASTALFDLGNFRTEGSPAGTAMFAVMLGFPPAALAALVGGILLIRGGRSATVRDLPVFADPPPPARREALWHTHASGCGLGVLINGDSAVLQYREPGAPTVWCSHNTRFRGSSSARYPFLCANGELLQLPTAWTVPTPLAQRAMEAFLVDGARPAAIAWRAFVAPPEAEAGSAAAWDLRLQDAIDTSR